MTKVFFLMVVFVGLSALGEARRAPSVWHIEVTLSKGQSETFVVPLAEHLKVQKASRLLFMPLDKVPPEDLVPQEIALKIPSSISPPAITKLNTELRGNTVGVRVVQSGPDGKRIADLLMPATLKGIEKGVATFVLDPRRFLAQGLKPQLEVVSSKKEIWAFEILGSTARLIFACASVYPNAEGKEIVALGPSRLISPTEIDFEDVIDTFMQIVDSKSEYLNMEEKKIVARIVMRDTEKRLVSYFNVVVSTTSLGMDFSDEAGQLAPKPPTFRATFKLWNSWPTLEEPPVKP